MECKNIHGMINIESRACLTRNELDFKYADSLDYVCVCVVCVCVCACACVRVRTRAHQISAN